MSQTEDLLHLSRALDLARRGRYTTHPNPRVGCVLVRHGERVGEGYHRRAGEPHAERLALAAAGVRAQGATAYVTLEPCSHQGRTPPCADALIEAGVVRVVAAMEDPNPLVAGRGLRRLKQAGIQVQVGLLADQALALNAGFVKRMTQGLPQVCCKLAMSLDGRTALAGGESKWITGAPARADVHRLRAASSAVLTGIGTVLADDPSLTARLEPQELADLGQFDQPMRVVLDSALRMPAASRMLELPGQTLVFCTEPEPGRAATLEAAGAQVIPVPGHGGHLDLGAVLRRLAEFQINELLVEAGPTLAGALLDGGWVDELLIYLAPCLLGDQARGLFSLPALRHMGERIQLELLELRAVGDDWRIRARARR